jgi:hypothetical protein
LKLESVLRLSPSPRTGRRALASSSKSFAAIRRPATACAGMTATRASTRPLAVRSACSAVANVRQGAGPNSQPVRTSRSPRHRPPTQRKRAPHHSAPLEPTGRAKRCRPAGLLGHNATPLPAWACVNRESAVRVGLGLGFHISAHRTETGRLRMEGAGERVCTPRAVREVSQSGAAALTRFERSAACKVFRRWQT